MGNLANSNKFQMKCSINVVFSSGDPALERHTISAVLIMVPSKLLKKNDALQMPSWWKSFPIKFPLSY